MNIFKINTVPRSVWIIPCILLRVDLVWVQCRLHQELLVRWLAWCFYLILSQLSLLAYLLVAILFIYCWRFYYGYHQSRFWDARPSGAPFWDEIVGFLFVMVALPASLVFYFGGIYFISYFRCMETMAH